MSDSIGLQFAGIVKAVVEALAGAEGINGGLCAKDNGSARGPDDAICKKGGGSEATPDGKTPLPLEPRDAESPLSSELRPLRMLQDLDPRVSVCLCE